MMLSDPPALPAFRHACERRARLKGEAPWLARWWANVIYWWNKPMPEKAVRLRKEWGM